MFSREEWGGGRSIDDDDHAACRHTGTHTLSMQSAISGWSCGRPVWYTSSASASRASDYGWRRTSRHTIHVRWRFMSHDSSGQPTKRRGDRETTRNDERGSKGEKWTAYCTRRK